MFKVSKLFRLLFGAAFGMGIVDGEGGGAALDAHGAADAFSSLLGGDAPNESESQEAGQQPVDDESEEAAAERQAKQELSDTEGDPQDAGKAEADELTIEVDGKSVKLNKAELAEYYKNGLRQADYTRKTMEAAEARKSAEAEASKAKQEREEYGTKLNHFAIATQSQLEQIRSQLAEIDIDANPVEYLHLQRSLEAGQAKLSQAQQEMARINEQRQAEQADADRRFLQTQQEILVDKLPEWKDPAKFKSGMEQLESFMTAQGFTAADGKTVLDARVILLARKAQQYDALISRAKETAKKVQALPTKVERSGNPETSRPDGRTTAMKQLERTGSVDAAANAFAQFIK